MQANFSLASQSNFEFSNQLPNNYKGSVLPGSNILTAFNPAIGTIIHQEFTNTHYTIRFNFFDLLQPLNLKGIQTGARLVSFLSLRNNINYKINSVGNIKLSQGQYSLVHTQDSPASASFLKPSIYECIEISWKDDWIKTFISSFQFLESLYLPLTQSKKGFFLQQRPRLAGVQALDLIHKILTANYEPEINKLFLKSRANEYLLLLLIESAKEPLLTVPLTEKERLSIIQIGQQIRKVLNKQFHLADLSRETGMNPTKLLKAFKEIHGDSMSNIHMSARMQEARRLVLETDLNLKQISTMVGYGFTQNFIKHFKKYFGYHTSEIRRKG